MNRAYNHPGNSPYHPAHPCPSCGEPIFVTHQGAYDATGTTTGPHTRLGTRRHPADIARSVHHQRADGHARHACPNLAGGDAA